MEGVVGTRRYAFSDAHPSPSKELPNTGKSRVERRPPLPPGASSSGSQELTDSDSTARSSKKSKEFGRLRLGDGPCQGKDETANARDNRAREKAQDAAERARRVEAKAAKGPQENKSSRKARPARPAYLQHAATQPVVQQSASRRNPPEDPSCYGVQQPATSGHRPRANSRPASYYAGQPRPSVASMAWYQSQQPSSPFAVGSFPPPPGSYGMPPPSLGFGPTAVPPPSPVGPPGYFDNILAPSKNQLKQRFASRPTSFADSQLPPALESYAFGDYDEQYERRMSRRASQSKKHREDRKAMPPPDHMPLRRPQSAMPSTPFQPPPPQGQQHPPSRHGQPRAPAVHRRSVGFADLGDDDFLDRDALFHDISPPPVSERQRRPVSRPRGDSAVYESADRRHPSPSRRGRRYSMYGSGASGGGGMSLDDEKVSKLLRDAKKYQDEVSGGPQVPLTVESLRKATKRGGVASSRSTRSSNSRDESEFKRSNTTGITQSSGGHNEELRVKITGAALVRVQGAEIECSNGGEIIFDNRPSGSQHLPGSTYQFDDGRSRVERKALPYHTKTPSSSDCHPRGYYQPAQDGYPAGNWL